MSWNVIISTQHKHKFSSRYTMQNGFEHRHMDFCTWMDYIREVGGPLYRVYESDGNTGLTRSHHISASFAQRLGENAMLKVEPYWQWLFDVPVELGFTYSVINHNLFYQDRAVPQDGSNPFSDQLGMNVGYAFSVKYTINRKHTAHHFILEYLQMRSFHGQTFDLRTHDLVNKYTSLTFPNIAYRVEF